MRHQARSDMWTLAALLALGACGRPDAALPSNSAAESPRASAPPEQAAAPAPTAAPLRPRTGPWSPSGYALNGSEPFWGGALTGTTIRYMTPEDQFGDVVETSLALAPDRETYAGSWRGRPFVLTLTRGPCTDGMSDRVYAFAASLQVAGGTRRGCADPQ